MQHEVSRKNDQRVISIEEYLDKRKKMREKERQEKNLEKSPALIWTELYV